MQSGTPELNAPIITVSETQDDFQTVQSALVRNEMFAPGTSKHGSANTAVMRFIFSDEERARVAAGDDLYLAMLTYAGPQQGVALFIGKTECAEAFGITAT